MSVVIIGGNDKMVTQYKDTCKKFDCKAKVFTQMNPRLEKKIGSPDLLILFTGTVSHKMVVSALNKAKRANINIARMHTSSITALKSVLQQHFGKCIHEEGACRCLNGC